MEEEIKKKILDHLHEFNVTQIINCFLRDSSKYYTKEQDKEEIVGRPSEYVKQMLMTTEERTEYIIKWRHKLRLPSCISNENPYFHISPNIVVFQQFTPGVFFSVMVTIRNVTSVSRYVRNIYEMNPFFTVDFCGSNFSTMLAPGLSVTYRVKFMPEKKEDYHYQLKFATDVGDVIVPVVAINSRGILDFPDRIEVPATATKIPSLKTIFVRNVGNVAAAFTLYTDNPCFWIEPSKGRIEEEESLQFIVHFLSNKAGDFEANMFLEYDTGEKLRIDLQSSAENCHVRIDRGTVRLEETFLGLSRSKTLLIHNRSNYIVKYKWMLFESVEADNERKEHYQKLYQLIYENELPRCVNLDYYNVCEPDIHKLIYQRIYTDQLESLVKETFEYKNMYFILSPIEAEIWPQSSAEVTVYFRAIELGEITSTAYLEVTGREERIPLTLYGIGKGPILQLNVLTIDLNNIYMCSVHNYEIIAGNKGHIYGTLIYKEKQTDFGGTINVTPPSLTLKPDELKSFNLSFSSNHKGDFVERVDFVVKETLEVLSLHIKGCIICPTLHFDKESLDFGTTALGFSTRQDVYLHNLALIPVAFTLTVLNDGNEVALTHEEFARSHTKPSFPNNPREFEVSPEEGVVASNDSMRIKVIYTANIARVGHTMIQVDMWDSGSHPVLLPITFCGKVTPLTIVPQDITVRFCFLNYPYSRSIDITNNSDIDGYFYFIQQQVTEDVTMICSFSKYQGYVKSHKSSPIDVTIMMKDLGIYTLTLNMFVMGGTFPLSYVRITCTGQGAVVSTDPSILDFGRVKVLEEKKMNFELINDSPIPTQFARESQDNSSWIMEPEFGDLLPHESKTITIKVFLVNGGVYKDKIMLSVIDSRTIHVDVKVIGYGCSVVFTPQIFPVFDWGLLFSHQHINRTITLMNRGTLEYQMIFINEPDVRFRRGQLVSTKSSKFKVEPQIVQIPAGETREINCRLFWEVNEHVVEKWYVYGQLQDAGKRELIDTSSFTIKLTEPYIVFNKKMLEFRVDRCPTEDKLQQTDELIVTNQSNLDLNVTLSTKDPFYLVTPKKKHVQTMKLVLVDKISTKITIFFSFDTNGNNCYSRSYEEVLLFEYREHPNRDKIICKGYVNYPNILIEPNDFIINCELGCSGEKILTLTNNGPISVVYKFLWLENSIEIKRERPVKLECPGCPSQEQLEPKKDILAVTETSEEPCVSDRQNGSGNEGQAPPVNSPVSEKQETMDENPDINNHPELKQGIRQFLLEIVEQYYEKDDDLIVLQNMNDDPPQVDYINEVLQIIPNEGTVLPYSMQQVYVGFHGFEWLQIKATAVCQILRGPTENVHMFARADNVRYDIDNDVIDFGQQLFLQRQRKCVTLKNICTITFDFEIRDGVKFLDDEFNLRPLKIEPVNGCVNPESSVQFQVDHIAMTLGRIDHHFQLEIAHLMPIMIKIVAYGVFPQVYPCIPKGKLHQHHSIELEYSAIQSMTDFVDNTVEKMAAQKKNDLFEIDMDILAAEEWCVISHEETFPRTMDIDMAVERLCAKKFIDENSYILMQHNTIQKKEPIPQLFSCEYIIDMKYVIIERIAHYSANIINYGPWIVNIRMKTVGKRDHLGKRGIVVQLMKNTNVSVGDYAVLQVTWYPTQEKFSEKATNVKHTIYIEVSHGCTIPVTIKGIVTYPYVTVNTKFLDFQDVVVGECLVLNILVKNEGLIDCKWEARLVGAPRKKRKEYYPFYVDYDSNYSPPGHFEIVRVYFKPRKTCYIETKLNIIVDMSLEMPVISLTGRGIEKSLNIIKSEIHFNPVIPFTIIQEIDFTIENTCHYPVEFFWHHLDENFQLEEDIKKTLLHYYNMKEILLPLKKPGDPMIPWQLMKFYKEILNEMAQSLITDKMEEEEEDRFGEEFFTFESVEKDTTKKSEKRGYKLSRKKKKRRGMNQQGKKTSVRGSSRRRKKNEIASDLSTTDSERRNCPTFSIFDETLLNDVPLPTTDPEEIQRLLFCYIDNLHKNPDLRSKMKDPVKEVFESVEKKSEIDIPDLEKRMPEKRVCIIFHGAPFTEYQETACRSAKVLGIPVLDIDKGITEIIAFNKSTCAIQLRQIIDEIYQKYIEAFEKWKQYLEQESTEVESESTKETSSRKKFPRKEKPLKSPPKKIASPSVLPKIEASIMQEAIIRLLPDPDPMTEFSKIPPSDKLELLDPLTRYEYKIQTILLLEKILDIHESPKVKGKSPKKKEETVSFSFRDIDPELIAEVLQQRLSLDDFKRGFVVQSLKSNFFQNNILDALLVVLRIIGYIEYFLFVTFLNSMHCYDNKVEQRTKEIESEMPDPKQRIREIDEMSASEYDQLSNEDKKMYVNTVLPRKKEEAARRRTRLMERMIERTKKKEVSKIKISKRVSKRNSKPSKTIKEVSKTSKITSSKQESKVTRSRDSSKRRKEEISPEIKEVMMAMDKYYSELSLIENVLNNWDPIKKTIEASPTNKSKIPRSARSKDVGPFETGIQEVPLNNFHIWYVRSNDPWEKTMYDVVVSQMGENTSAKLAIPVEMVPEPDLRPKIYSIIRWTCIEKRVKKIPSIVYNLVSLTPTVEVSCTFESNNTSELSVQESNVKKNRRRRKNLSNVETLKSTSKENQSLMIESKDVNLCLAPETMVEEPLKPRWILLPGESQRYKIRFQPEETGRYEETYAVTIAEGNCITYDINVIGVADVPRLDMNPDTIFMKTMATKLHATDNSVYFYDTETYDFGSQLLFHQDQKPHYRKARLKFCNISEVPVEVFFSLSENECFSIEPQMLYIDQGDCATLMVTSLATRLGIIKTKLLLCITNNPKVEILMLQNEGTKLDIELDGKNMLFGRTLLYRIEYRYLTIINNTPVSFFWFLELEDQVNPQISFIPYEGMIDAHSRQEVEFQYNANMIGMTEKKIVKFKAFLAKEDSDPVFTEIIQVSGETYDVTVDINDANPIDFKNIKAEFPAKATFTMRNRGNYEVKYVITLQEKEKLDELNLPRNFKKNVKVEPSSGTISPHTEKIVELTLHPMMELVLKEVPILMCNLIDMQKKLTIIAEIPLKVSLVSFYTRFRVHPYPVVSFGTMAICTEKTMYINIENTGKFPLHYFLRLVEHPSVIYMTKLWPLEIEKKKPIITEVLTKKTRRGIRTDKSALSEPEKIILGPMTITKLEGNVDVGQMDSVAINCYPEFVGSQEEQIVLVVPDTIPEDKDGKIITLSVTSSIPCIDFLNFDEMFHENYVVERIQDFDCSNDIGPHTVFARQEKCLYFRFISVQSTHTACFKLFNYGIVPVNISIELIEDSFLPNNTRFTVFVIEPMYEQILPMNHKVFTVSFTPSTINTFHAQFHAKVVLPSHLEADELIVKLIGESCVPEVAITEPIHATRETPCLNFPRTLIDEGSCKYFVLKNVGFIKAKVIVEIVEDPNNVFTFFPCPDTQHLLQILEDYCNEPYDRCTVVRLGFKDTACFKATFAPEKIGKFYGKIRLHVIDNPYENLTINLEGDCYVEAVVLEGLPLDDNKVRISNVGNRENYRRKLTSRQASLLSESNNQSVNLPYLTYILDYGLCFVSKMYKKTFKIINKTTDRWFRFQWGLHNHVVFEPSTGHIKYLTFKEIIVTFLATEPKTHQNTSIECSICEILVENPDDEIAWDDRQTEVQWNKVYSDLSMNDDLLKKTVEPTMESNHNIVPGTTKILQLLLNANVAYSEYSCIVEEIFFKDTLMYQTREYTFTLTNPGVVNTMYIWKINMDEQYPKRYLGENSNVNSRQKMSESSSHVSKSFRGTLSAMSQRNYYEDDVSADDSKFFSQQCTSFITDSVDIKGLSTTRPSDLFSSTAGLSGRTTDSWLEGDDLPFAIHPEMGTIPPGKSEECTLKFSPKDVFYYKAYLTCKIENLNPHLPILMIPVVARSLLPYCHFDVQESDYVSSGRRNAHLPGPVGYEIDDPDLWRNIRVIEFKVIGVGETHVRKFHLVNPTVDDYHFSWKNQSLLSGIEISNFHCTVTEGIAERGKRTDMSFTFLASDIGVFESFWLFSIEKYNLECLFLVVGIVTEPSVYCMIAHVKLKPTILGFNVRESIKFLNNENFHIPFRVVEESLYSEGKFQKLNITPMTGTLVSKCEQHLWIEYHPTRVGEFKFYIQCAVNLMKKPITILVNAYVYDISLSVTYCLPSGEIATAIKNKENVIDFGKIIPEIPNTVKFDLKNTCKVAFYYCWELGITSEVTFKNSYTITTSQKQGHLTSENQCTCYLTLTTFQKIHIKDHCVLLKISNGPFYKFILKAFSKKPAIEFSFNRYDFGYCYIHENESIPYKTELTVTNTEDISYVLECKYEKKPHLFIDLNFMSEALAAHSKIVIPINFQPFEEIKYHECLVFVINSLYERKITITGEGIPYKIYLVNSRDKVVDLGNISPMKVVVKKIPVVNKGLAPVKMKFGVMQYLGGYDNYYENLGYCNIKRDTPILAKASIMETKRSWTFDTMLETLEPKLYEILKIKPSTNVILKPNKRINVMIFFKPTARMRPFSVKIALQTNSNVIPLFLLRGSCIGMEFRLNRSHIFFGTIIQDCIEESKMILMNTGDLGSRFKWNVAKLPKDFQIIPMSGYCSVDTHIVFVVKFQPFEQKNIIEGEAYLEIEKHASLGIKISGACCKLPDPTDTIDFESFVREKQTRSVIIMNDSNAPWRLKIEVKGDYFSADQLLQVPPLQLAPCVVTYAPVSMNTDETLDTGSLVLKCPEENVYLIYLLRGKSLPPRVTENIVRRIPAKTKYTELLPVHNWLDRQQRFHCKIEWMKDYDDHNYDHKEVPIYSFVGNEKFDVPANSQRDYHAVFYCYDKWNFHFKVTFTNDEQEYQFYEIEYEVTEPEVIESIKLTTTVRSEICYPLKFENPLEYIIKLKANCLNPFITVKVPRLMPPQSYEYISIYFHPLLPCDESVIVDIYSTYMGLFPYELQLRGVPAPPESVTRVNAYLGNITEFSLILKNLTTDYAQFAIQVDNNCFTCPEIVEVAREDVYMLKVIFEPCDVENVSATLTASSITAGEFIFPLIGSCSLPKPMGPYIITRISPASISFKNIFRKAKTFNFIVDEPDSFTVNTSSITLNSKQSIVVNVNIKDTEQYKEEKIQEEKYPVTGKLIVYCTDPEFSHINWVYYLRGIFE